MLCDKGGGLLILNHQDYLSSCYKHLSTTRKNSDGTETPFYEKVDEKMLDEAKAAIKKVLDEGLENEIITKHEHSAMDPSEK